MAFDYSPFYSQMQADSTSPVTTTLAETPSAFSSVASSADKANIQQFINQKAQGLQTAAQSMGLDAGTTYNLASADYDTGLKYLTDQAQAKNNEIADRYVGQNVQNWMGTQQQGIDSATQNPDGTMATGMTPQQSAAQRLEYIRQQMNASTDPQTMAAWKRRLDMESGNLQQQRLNIAQNAQEMQQQKAVNDMGNKVIKDTQLQAFKDSAVNSETMDARLAVVKNAIQEAQNPTDSSGVKFDPVLYMGSAAEKAAGATSWLPSLLGWWQSTTNKTIQDAQQNLVAATTPQQKSYWQQILDTGRGLWSIVSSAVPGRTDAAQATPQEAQQALTKLESLQQPPTANMTPAQQAQAKQKNVLINDLMRSAVMGNIFQWIHGITGTQMGPQERESYLGNWGYGKGAYTLLKTLSEARNAENADLQNRKNRAISTIQQSSGGFDPGMTQQKIAEIQNIQPMAPMDPQFLDMVKTLESSSPTAVGGQVDNSVQPVTQTRTQQKKQQKKQSVPVTTTVTPAMGDVPLKNEFHVTKGVLDDISGSAYNAPADSSITGPLGNT